MARAAEARVVLRVIVKAIAADDEADGNESEHGDDD
jgi:hypothetical protein